MKGLAATAVFLVKGVILATGVVLAANGKGVAVLLVGLLIMAAMFVKLGCIDNSPKH